MQPDHGTPSYRWLLARTRWHGPLLVLLCGFVYFAGLGRAGLNYSEGLRTLPAWEMLDTGEFLVPHLFGRPYVTKPPGVLWAIAGMSSLLGRTEFAARSVSALAATLAVLLTYAVGNRWFGKPWGFVAGASLALMPLFWGYARAAEIESLNDLATLAGMVCCLALLLEERSWRSDIGWTLGLAAALVAIVLAKGPAGVPCVAGAMVAACVVRRGLRPLGRPGLWVALLGAGAVIGGLAWLANARLAAATQPPVAQPVGVFLWELSRWRGIVALLPETLAWGLPITPALIAPLLPRGRDRRLPLTPEDEKAEFFGRAVTASCLCSLGVYLLAGLANPRYAMPALMIAPLGVGYAVRRASQPDAWAPLWRRSIRLATLGHPLSWSALLLVGAAVWIGVLEPRRGATSGRLVADGLADALPRGATLHVGFLTLTRPELPHYAREQHAAQGSDLRLRWLATETGDWQAPAPGSFLLVQDDIDKQAVEARLGQMGLQQVAHGRVHKSDWTLYRLSRGQDEDRPPLLAGEEASPHR